MKRIGVIGVGAVLGVVLGVVLGSARAEAAVAEVTVGPLTGPGAGPVADGPYVQESPPFIPQENEAYRSPVRFGVGPAGFFGGHADGLGLGANVDFGTGIVGFRLSGAWMGDGARWGDAASTGGSLGLDQYAGEFVLDMHPRGPLHPVLGLGFGLTHAELLGKGGNMGVGLGRLGLEYSLELHDADMRIGVSASGALPGPREASVPSDLGPYALLAATLTLGF
jgi:hypothetical protein